MANSSFLSFQGPIVFFFTVVMSWMPIQHVDIDQGGDGDHCSSLGYSDHDHQHIDPPLYLGTPEKRWIFC